MAFLNFSIELEDTDPDLLMDLVREPLRAAAEKGMKTLIKQGIYEVIAKWKHDPVFSITLDQDKASVTAEAHTGDEKYIWVDQGTGPYSFSVDKPRYMKFPFAGIGASYSAKTDGGSGERIGSPIRANTIKNRGIEARDITNKAIEDHLDGGEVVWIVIEQALGG